MEPTTWSECRPNADGFFGSTNGSVYVVAYAYELETSFGNAQDDIIPALEKAISAAILPELFVNQCTDPSLNSTGKNSSVVGVSTRPDDVILDDVQCQAQLNDTYNCYVVMGGLTLFVDGSLQDEAGRVIDTLQQDMENDSFVDSSIGIERVTLVDLEPDPNPGTGTGGDEGSQNKGRNNGLIYGIVAGVAALLLALAAFAWRRRKQDEETAESLA
jgi:MYXO-CTERM domain-containing protein